VAHPQIPWASIGGKDFTLYYDYDRQNLSCLDADGKVEWFKRRMEFVFLEPLKALYGGKTPAHRALSDFLIGVGTFFEDVKAARRADFLRRFDYLYPP
jgi:hypothetical protein